METTLDRPHDRLFKSVFGVPENALGLAAELFPSLAEAIDAASVVEADAALVDARLREVFCDVLFTARLEGKETLVHLLFEHKSTIDPLTPYQVLLYLLRIWEEWVRKHPAPGGLPPVVPIVVHQGPGPWTGPRSLAGILNLPEALAAELRRALPAFELTIHDLGALDAATLGAVRAPPLARLGLLLLKAGRLEARALDVLDETAGAVRELVAQPGGLDWLDTLLRYIYGVVRGVPRDELRERLMQIYPEEAKEKLMTVAEEIKAEGRAEGLAKGRAEGMKGIMRLALESRFGPLSADRLARIDAASPEELEGFARRLATAPDLAAIFRQV